MVKLLIIFLLPLVLNASKILSYNIYDRTDRVDIMITFDTPYEGKIKQSQTDSKITIKLEDASIESKKSKDLTSKFLNAVDILPVKDATNIVAYVPSSVRLKASKTSDAYGLRLRFSNPAAKNNTLAKTQNKKFDDFTASLPTKKSEGISTRYYIVIGFMFVGVAILFLLKNKIQNAPAKESKTASWLFKVAQEAKNAPAAEPTVSIRFQKAINKENSVVMLDFAEQSYLVLMGTNNLLLDRFTDNKPVTQSEFETILQNRHQELDDFLNEVESEAEKDPMQIYKEKAANISYTT